MRILKWFGLGLLTLLILAVALNWSKIQRLMTVNTLFDADKIVENFSSMDSAFLHHDLEIGESKPWPEDIQDIPETVMIAGKETSLAAALEELDTTALVIIRDGTLIHESYYKDTGRDDLRISWSVAKSFMSGLYGQAIEDGLMDISQPIETYLPQLTGTAYEGATVANILNMASGVKFNEDYMDPKSDINDMGRVLGLGGSMDEYTETLVERQYEPGTVWQYVSIDTHVAAMALRKVTGKSLHQLWEETYGENLGMGKAPYYMTDGYDVAFALGGLNLRTRDYAKFGQLFLQGGEWEGEQLVPVNWVKDSTSNHAPNIHPVRGTGYGYQWWVPMPQDGSNKGDYFAVGIYGQYVYVNPAMGIVIAKNAADREFTQAQSNGQHSVNMNIDMFRSLAEQLAVTQKTEMKHNSNVSEPLWEIKSAECLERDHWVCEATFSYGDATVVSDFSFLMLRNVPDEAIGEAERSNLYRKLEGWTENMPTHDAIDILKFERQSHKVVDISEWDDKIGLRITIESKFWKNGQSYVSERSLPFVSGEPQYQ